MTEIRTNGGGQTDDSQDVKWPKLDEAAYHGFAGEVVRTIAPHTEADPVALLIQFLTCFGNIVGRTRHYYRWDMGRQQANLFAALVGQTAKARKGTAFVNVRDIIQEADPVWDRERVKGGMSSGEGLIHPVRDPIMKFNPKTQEEEVSDPGVVDKRLLIQETEFASVLAVMTRNGNILSPLIRKAWDGVRLEKLTAHSPWTATNPHISIIGHITEDELRASLTRTDMASGFANRFLFTLVKRSKLLPYGSNLSPGEIQRLRAEFASIVGVVKGDPLDMEVQISMTEAATAEWGQIYPSLTAERPGLLGAIVQRAEPQTIRLALIYALLDKANQIDLPHLQAALAVWNYCEASTVRIFGDTLGDEVADSIMRALKSAGRNGMSRSTIRELFSNNQPRERISAALGLLAQKGRVRVENQAGKTRPTEMWFAVSK